MHDFLESFPKLWIEYCVDDRIDEAVDVAEPGGQYECRYAWLTIHIQFGAHGIHDIACEKRYPTEQKHTYCRKDNGKKRE